MSQGLEISTAEFRKAHPKQSSTLLHSQITKRNPSNKNLLKMLKKSIKIRKTKSKNSQAIKSPKKPSKEPN
jgi:hypothetical protein